MPVDSDRIADALAQAVALPADARTAFLDSFCADDRAMREEVESLLAAHDSAAGFLSRPTLGASAGQARFDAAIGAPIERYRLVNLIGEGGFGSVFLAEQESPVRRQVAIKIIKPGMDSRQVIARFKLEQQTLAVLDHPHIARVIDAGMTAEQRPYFVMEYVPGRPITAFADQHKLSIAHRLELFQQVCDAIAHAHTKAILHRDIKASNVLAFEHDGKFAVKVIDFGIAKALSESDASMHLTITSEQCVGSLESMSPEQADGSRDIDTRSDVYALGVLLYELLCGQKPFNRGELLAGSGIDGIRNAIRTTAPARPSALSLSQKTAEARTTTVAALSKQLRQELEWIPLKAIRKERERRYESVAALSDDVGRYLAGRALHAGPESRAYVARKFVSRNRAAFVAGAIAIAVLGIATGIYGYRIHEERLRTQSANDAQRQVNQFLTNMLAAANPNELSGSRNVTLKQFLDQASSRVAADCAGRPDIEAPIRKTIGRSYFGLGEYEAAETHFRRAYELRCAQGGDDSAEALDVLGDLTNTLVNLKRGVEGQALATAGRDRARTKWGDSHPVTLKCENEVAMAQVEAGDLAGGEQTLRSAISRFDAAGIHDDLLYCHLRTDLAVTLGRERKDAPAVDFARESLTRAKATLGFDSIHARSALSALASALNNLGRYEEAAALFREALDSYRQRYGPVHENVQLMEFNLAYALFKAGHPTEAEPFAASCNEQIVRAGKSAEPDAERVFAIHALILQAIPGREPQAIALHRQVYALRRARLPEGNPDLISSAFNLAEQLERAKMYEEALKPAECAYRAIASTHVDPTQEARTCGVYGLTLAGLKRYEEAEPILRRSIELRRQTNQTKSKTFARIAESLAAICASTGRDPEAASLRREAALAVPATRPATTNSSRSSHGTS